VDRQIIHQALLNLLLNACEFTDRGGQITVISNGTRNLPWFP